MDIKQDMEIWIVLVKKEMKYIARGKLNEYLFLSCTGKRNLEIPKNILRDLKSTGKFDIVVGSEGIHEM